MGLDITHGAWEGPYSAFSRWRTALARAAGGDMWDTTPGMAWFTYDDLVFSPLQEAGFRILMGHSDCDGEIPPASCALVASALTVVMPSLSEEEPGVRGMTMRETTEQFIQGCMVAHERGECLEFG